MVRIYYEKPKRIEKLSKDQKADLMFDLINSFSRLKNATESANFLEDLLTANEIKNLSIRLRIAKMLLADKTQREISSELHTSFATVNKVSIWLNERGDGFRKVISKLPLKWSKPTNFPRGPIEYHLPELIQVGVETVMANKQQKVLDRFTKEVEDKKYKDEKIAELNKETFSQKKRMKKLI